MDDLQNHRLFGFVGKGIDPVHFRLDFIQDLFRIGSGF